MPTTKSYIATKAGRLGGRRVAEGDRIELTEAQAKYAHVREAEANELADPAPGAAEPVGGEPAVTTPSRRKRGSDDA